MVRILCLYVCSSSCAFTCVLVRCGRLYVHDVGELNPGHAGIMIRSACFVCFIVVVRMVHDVGELDPGQAGIMVRTACFVCFIVVVRMVHDVGELNPGHAGIMVRTACHLCCVVSSVCYRMWES